MNKMIECVCGSCNTEEIKTYRELVYKGFVQTVEVLHTECYDCGNAFATRFQVNRNASQSKIAKFTIDQWILDSVDE
jgi:hypothetical protein